MSFAKTASYILSAGFFLWGILLFFYGNFPQPAQYFGPLAIMCFALLFPALARYEETKRLGKSMDCLTRLALAALMTAGFGFFLIPILVGIYQQWA